MHIGLWALRSRAEEESQAHAAPSPQPRPYSYRSEFTTNEVAAALGDRGFEEGSVALEVFIEVARANCASDAAGDGSDDPRAVLFDANHY